MKADLHIHTHFSYDGSSSPQQVVNSAIEKDINCICITDHQEIKGAIEAMKYAHDKNILVIPGIEILSDSGDVLGINVKKIIPDKLSIKKTIEEIRKQGGLAVIPHPFNWPLSFFGGEKGILAACADAIEILNSNILFSFLNKKAAYFCQRNNFSFTAGSDAHRAEFIGRAYIDFPGDIVSENDLLEKIKNKKGKAKGTLLSYLEMIKNGLKGDIGGLIRDYIIRSNRKAT